MDRIVIEGGARLAGEVRVSGSKNATLASIAASLLAEGETVLRNVPRLRDIETMLQILGALGVPARWDPEGSRTLRIDATAGVRSPEAPYDLVRKMRASFLVLGPLLTRHGVARVSEPGGCAIGVRPIDQHLKGLRALGAKVQLDHGYVEATSARLRGARIAFDLSTVNGTQNVMMAAALAEGETLLENAAREPEVVDLARALTRMGADIRGAGTDRVAIRGVRRLEGIALDVPSDRIEAGTLLTAAVISRGDVRVAGIDPALQKSVIEKLEDAGAEVEVESDAVRARAADRVRGVRIVTAPYPGVPTDMQAQLMAVLTLAQGSSVITETVFENRFMHVPELQRMGADITVDGRSAHVRGVPALAGAPVMATDLRASAGLILAGLAAEGTTRVSRVYHIDRGYERIEEKLRSLGAVILREG